MNETKKLALVKAIDAALSALGKPKLSQIELEGTYSAALKAISAAGYTLVPNNPSKKILERGIMTVTLPWEDDLFPSNLSQEEKDLIIMRSIYIAMIQFMEE